MSKMRKISLEYGKDIFNFYFLPTINYHRRFGYVSNLEIRFLKFYWGFAFWKRKPSREDYEEVL